MLTARQLLSPSLGPLRKSAKSPVPRDLIRRPSRAPKRLSSFKRGLKEAQSVPWSTPVSGHHVGVVRAIREAAVKAFGVAPGRPRKCYVSVSSLDLIPTRRVVQRVLIKVSGAPCGGPEAALRLLRFRGRLRHGDILGITLNPSAV
eukprot:8715013-Pyramimonas_sp.AAC.2